MINSFNESMLTNLYGTLENLEEHCDKCHECWMEIPNLKYGEHQKPYKPYFGRYYNGLMFAGINLNGGNDSIDAIDKLVHSAIKNYLVYGKYRIFKQEGYRGSPFFYYIPLLSFLFSEYSNKKIKFSEENNLTNEQIISGFNYCGITNIIKCSINSPDGRSTPSSAMYLNCVNKFKDELNKIAPDVLVIFTLFKFPSLLTDYFDGFNVISNSERSRIQKNNNFYVLELEHPLSTSVTRKQKYESYSKAIYELIDLQQKA